MLQGSSSSCKKKPTGRRTEEPAEFLAGSQYPHDNKATVDLQPPRAPADEAELLNQVSELWEITKCYFEPWSLMVVCYAEVDD